MDRSELEECFYSYDEIKEVVSDIPAEGRSEILSSSIVNTLITMFLLGAIVSLLPQSFLSITFGLVIFSGLCTVAFSDKFIGILTFIGRRKAQFCLILGIFSFPAIFGALQFNHREIFAICGVGMSLFGGFYWGERGHYSSKWFYCANMYNSIYDNCFDEAIDYRKLWIKRVNLCLDLKVMNLEGHKSFERFYLHTSEVAERFVSGTIPIKWLRLKTS